jgi:hypothetical protein
MVQHFGQAGDFIAASEHGQPFARALGADFFRRSRERRDGSQGAAGQEQSAPKSHQSHQGQHNHQAETEVLLRLLQGAEAGAQMQHQPALL